MISVSMEESINWKAIITKVNSLQKQLEMIIKIKKLFIQKE